MQMAGFSALLPNTHIDLHNGYAGYSDQVLRAHLGLRVPAGCEIAVHGEKRSWKAGKWLIFDDTLYHEAWNNGYVNATWGRTHVHSTHSIWPRHLHERHVGAPDDFFCREPRNAIYMQLAYTVGRLALAYPCRADCGLVTLRDLIRCGQWSMRNMSCCRATITWSACYIRLCNIPLFASAPASLCLRMPAACCWWVHLVTATRLLLSGRRVSWIAIRSICRRWRTSEMIFVLCCCSTLPFPTGFHPRRSYIWCVSLLCVPAHYYAAQ